MQSSDKGLTIIFNGEIYNFLELRKVLESKGHQFISNSDTEVLLAAYAEWGNDFLPRINGMFAFAIYDYQKGKVFFARDRAGEKPFYYHLLDGKLLFASELKALLLNPEMPRKINVASLDCYLSMGYVPGERCILEGYKKLPAAHAMEFDLNTGKNEIWRYWSIPEYKQSGVDENLLLDELELLTEDAVARQCMADVDVGILLSGGVDSSIITAMAARNSRKVNTFTIGFPGGKRFDETQHAQNVSNHFCTNHRVLVAEPTNADLFPKLAGQFDEPIVDSSIFPTYLVTQLVKNHCTVVLGGEGGDELFGGYSQYSRILWMQKWLAFIPFGFQKLFSRTVKDFFPEGLKGTNYVIGLEAVSQKKIPQIGIKFDKSSRYSLLKHYQGYRDHAEEIYAIFISKQDDLLQMATRMDFTNYLTEDLLVKIDRCSMLNSVEVRSPFLDHRIIEFAFKCIPSHLKATSIDKKILLKKLAKRILYPGFDLNRKQGFSIPLSQWLVKGPFRNLFYDVLTSSDCLFNPGKVNLLLKEQDQGLRNSERLFALVQFELWRKTYNAYI